MRRAAWHLVVAFGWGWIAGKGFAAGAAAWRSRKFTAATPAGPIVLTADQERAMLEHQAQVRAAAEELEARFPLAAAALRKHLEAYPPTLYVVREEVDGGVPERTVALAG